MTAPSSPRITRVAWGLVETEDGGKYKDVKLYPGGSTPWDWSKTGTKHEPGIQPSDIEEILAHGARELVLSKGISGYLKVCPETLKILQEKEIPVHILRTEEAVVLYNEMVSLGPVGGLFHSKG